MVKKEKKTKDKDIKVVEELSTELLDKLGIKTDIQVGLSDDGETINVVFSPQQERGLIIGKRGETIDSIQYILALMFKQKTGEWKRVNLDVDGWREKQEDYLISLAEKTAQRAIDSNSPQNLYNLNSSQRRVIHLQISKTKGVTSESLGEGRERYLVIKPSEKQ